MRRETPCVLGLEQDAALALLREHGINSVKIIEYSSKKGVTGADCARVIRQRQKDCETELIVSRFKARPEKLP